MNLYRCLPPVAENADVPPNPERQLATVAQP
jgi:hypothetical protein